jgi:r-opsin
VAITNVMLWALAWTPYAVVAMIGCYGNQELVSPLVSQLPVFLGRVILMIICYAHLMLISPIVHVSNDT